MQVRYRIIMESHLLRYMHHVCCCVGHDWTIAKSFAKCPFMLNYLKLDPRRTSLPPAPAPRPPAPAPRPPAPGPD